MIHEWSFNKKRIIFYIYIILYIHIISTYSTFISVSPCPDNNRMYCGCQCWLRLGVETFSFVWAKDCYKYRGLLQATVPIWSTISKWLYLSESSNLSTIRLQQGTTMLFSGSHVQQNWRKNSCVQAWMSFPLFLHTNNFMVHIRYTFYYFLGNQTICPLFSISQKI